MVSVSQVKFSVRWCVCAHAQAHACKNTVLDNESASLCYCRCVNTSPSISKHIGEGKEVGGCRGFTSCQKRIEV